MLIATSTACGKLKFNMDVLKADLEHKKYVPSLINDIYSED